MGKIALKDRLTKEAGYSTINENYEQLVGKSGTTISDLRPVGTIEIDNRHYSGISNAQYIKKDIPIQVVSVDGTRILVKQIENHS